LTERGPGDGARRRATVTAKFPGNPNKPSEIVSDLRQIVNNAQKSPDWANAPQVQAAVNTLSTDADELEQTAIHIDYLRKELAQAEETQAAQLIACKQHRKHAEATVTVASKGAVGAVKAWGCAVAGRTISTPTDEAPQNLSAKNTRTPGDVVVRCKGVRAKVYVFHVCRRSVLSDGIPGTGDLVDRRVHRDRARRRTEDLRSRRGDPSGDRAEQVV
jgi:hypothetical protein